MLGMKPKLGEAALPRSATQLIGKARRAFSAGATARRLAQRERVLRARGRVRVRVDDVLRETTSPRTRATTRRPSALTTCERARP